MESMKTMTIQMPEETYQRMKDYLKRHQVKQKDLLIRLLEAALEKKDSPRRRTAMSEQKQLLFAPDSGIILLERR